MYCLIVLLYLFAIGANTEQWAINEDEDLFKVFAAQQDGDVFSIFGTFNLDKPLLIKKSISINGFNGVLDCNRVQKSGIVITANSVLINGLTFQNCHTGLTLQSPNNSQAIINNSTFLHNSISLKSVNFSARINVQITNCIFKNNSNFAVQLMNCNSLSLLDSIFVNNSGNNAVDINFVTNFTINNINITGNNVSNTIGIHKSAGTIHNAHLRDNYGIGGSGLNLLISNVSILSSLFEYNSFPRGTIYAQHGIYNISNSLFISNNASEGGAIYNVGSSITISSSSFLHNMAKKGAAIYGEDYQKELGSCQIQIINSTFNNNSASQFGGAFYMKSGNLSLSSVLCNNNIANSGGCIYSLYSSNYIINSNISNNVATYGGAINCVLTNNTTIISSLFQENSATGYAGAIVISGNGTIENCIFLMNSDGALYYSNNIIGTDLILVKNTIFKSNNGENGGAVHLLHPKGAAIITNCSFINNTANQGGAIYSRNTKLDLIESIITNNTALLYGGGVVITDISKPVFLGSNIIVNNTAIQHSGLYIDPKFKQAVVMRETLLETDSIVPFCCLDMVTKNPIKLLCNFPICDTLECSQAQTCNFPFLPSNEDPLSYKQI